jgi:osmotically-inducible protein OsmY
MAVRNAKPSESAPRRRPWRRVRRSGFALLLSGLALLGACGRNETQTPGQKLDAVIARTEQKADELKLDARKAGEQARVQAGRLATEIGAKARDAAISAKITARIAQEASPSAFRIDADTVDGRVVLHGSAPDEPARQRAAELAQGVDGVVSVTNDLSLSPRP